MGLYLGGLIIGMLRYDKCFQARNLSSLFRDNPRMMAILLVTNVHHQVLLINSVDDGSKSILIRVFK